MTFHESRFQANSLYAVRGACTDYSTPGEAGAFSIRRAKKRTLLPAIELDFDTARPEILTPIITVTPGIGSHVTNTNLRVRVFPVVKVIIRGSGRHFIANYCDLDIFKENGVISNYSPSAKTSEM